MRKAFKKAIAVLLVTVMVFGAAPLAGFVGLDLPEFSGFKKIADSVSEFFDGFAPKAEAAVTSGTCGDNLIWSFDEPTGTLTISGTGEMYDYGYDYSYPWHHYRSNIKFVTIGNDVTSIGGGAFYSCGSLSSATIGKGVMIIGDYAFAGTGLTNISIPDSLKSIGNHAFFSCFKLTNITIPNNVTNIGNGAFAGCNCLTNVQLGNGVTHIGDYAFSGCPLTILTIPDSVVFIGNSSFEACKSLISATIGNGVTHIGNGAFRHCISLQNVKIPSNVTSIGNDAFAFCYSLLKITVDSLNSMYSCDEYGVLLNKDKTNLIQYPAGNKRTSYIIPDSVKTLNVYAFADCDYLTSITITDNVSSIDDNTFYHSNRLSNITVNSANTFFSSDEYGVLFDKNKTQLIQYPVGNARTTYFIPKGVTKICNNAFYYCHSLVNVKIPNGVISIGDDAFYYCKNLTDISIPDSTLNIGKEAFGSCFSLTSIQIPDSVKCVGEDAFSYCSSLTDAIIGNGMTNIEQGVFLGCDNLKNIVISNSVENIGDLAFNSCNSLTGVFYEGTEEEWDAISIGNWNEPLFNAEIYYNWNGELPSTQYQKITILEDIVFLDIGEHYQFNVCDKNGIDITDEVIWDDITSVGSTGEVEFVNPGEVTATKEGLTSVLASYHHEETKELIGFDSCYVFVGDPNEIKYHSISDTIYYYGENAFYSDACQFSDSVDIYISLKNAIHDQIEFLTEYDKYADELETLALNGYTLTASVSGSNLSFNKNEYINSYTSAIDTDIPIDKAVDELLTLYPYNLDVGSEDKNFTVTIKIESEDFETFTDSFTFKISSLEDKEINEHISFIDTNGTYRAMRDNDFATGMTDLKNDSQYIWSKYSTLDFENYYEVLMADIMVQLMGTQLTGNISILPALKEWADNYKKILDNVTTIVDNNYTGYIDVSKNALDKLFKKSQYVTEPNKVKDELRDTVIDLLGTTENIEKINTAFGYIDKTGQVLDFIDFGVDIANDIIDYVNCVSIMNSYKSMNDEFKNVIKKVYDCIPNDDWKVKDAVDHYVNLDTSAGYTKEIIESAIELAKDITLETYKSLFRKQIVSIVSKAIGSIKLASGALLSTTTAFSTITTGLGAVSTGATLGLCISDILCNNSGQAQEMGKVVAASALAPYVIQTMRYYEWALKNYKDESSLKHFETAFNLNKTLQIYSIEHTYKGLEVQANSIVIQLFSKRDYPGAMAELASLKIAHVKCNCCEDIYTGVIKTKTIAIKCPVDVYIYCENGKEVVRIINDIAEFVEDGINVFIYGREKYVTVPADREYSIKIVATDKGTMDYMVVEHDENGRYKRIVNNPNINLTKNQIFTGNICKEFDVNKDSYAINTDDGVIKPSDSVDVSLDEIYPEVLIRLPSTTSINYSDAIILHADVTGTLPAGATIKWTASNDNFDFDVRDNGASCKITPSSSGDTIFTATVYDANNKVVSEDTQEMTSKAGFFDKIIAFFKKLFGLTKTIPEVFKF